MVPCETPLQRQPDAISWKVSGARRVTLAQARSAIRRPGSLTGWLPPGRPQEDRDKYRDKSRGKPGGAMTTLSGREELPGKRAFSHARPKSRSDGLTKVPVAKQPENARENSFRPCQEMLAQTAMGIL
jgi:hypothetical protein